MQELVKPCATPFLRGAILRRTQCIARIFVYYKCVCKVVHLWKTTSFATFLQAFDLFDFVVYKLLISCNIMWCLDCVFENKKILRRFEAIWCNYENENPNTLDMKENLINKWIYYEQDNFFTFSIKSQYMHWISSSKQYANFWSFNRRKN